MATTEAIDTLSIALDDFLEAARVVRKERKLRPIQRALAKNMGALFRRQGAAFLRAFAKFRDRFVPVGQPEVVTESVVPTEWLALWAGVEALTTGRMETLLRTAVGAAMLEGAEDVLSDLRLTSVRFDLKNPRAVAYLRAHAAELVTGINETTSDALGRIIAEASDEGWSYGQVAKAITGEFAEFSQKRAQTIAVTEAAAGYEEANRIVAQDLAAGGLAMEKASLSVGDDRVSEICRGNEDAGWIPVDAAFPSGDQRPPFHPRCRCTTLFRRAPEEA